MVAERSLTEIQGIVCGVNPKGLKLQGEESWRNYSKRATLPESLPTRGDVVVVSIDGAGFIRGLSVSPSERPDSGRSSRTEVGTTVLTSAANKDVQIARMHCLTDAITMLATSGAVDADEALALASKFATWVLL